MNDKLMNDKLMNDKLMNDKLMNDKLMNDKLNDEREVMFFQIRNVDGSLDPVSAGVIVEADGSPRSLRLDEVQVKMLDYWKSPHSQARYPAQWAFSIPSEGIDLTFTSLIADQDLRLLFVCWESAARIEGPQTGFGYVEMTGYAHSMQGQF